MHVTVASAVNTCHLETNVCTKTSYVEGIFVLNSKKSVDRFVYSEGITFTREFC